MPKGAEVEVQMNVHTGRRAPREQLYSDTADTIQAAAVVAADDDDDDDELGPVYASGSNDGLRWETYRVSDSEGRCSGGCGGRGSRAVVFVDAGELGIANPRILIIFMMKQGS